MLETHQSLSLKGKETTPPHPTKKAHELFVLRSVVVVVVVVVIVEEEESDGTRDGDGEGKK